MGAGHSHPLYVHDHSPLHHLPPEAKIVSAFGIAFCAAVTPRQAIWAFAVYLVGVSTLIILSRIPLKFIALRLVALAPFLLFALFVPFVASGETTEVVGVSVSVAGVWAAWNIFIKALIGGTVSILLTATTEIPEIIRGLGVLRVPALLTSITTFMIRYLELIAGELGRMRVAMTARGYDPRWLSQVKPIANSAGVLFVRTYERGERIHSAMLARGFTGTMPSLDHRRASGSEWLAVISVVCFFAVTATTALLLT